MTRVASTRKRAALMLLLAAMAACAARPKKDCGCAEKKARAAQASTRSTSLPALPLPPTFLRTPDALAVRKARWIADRQHPEPAVARLLAEAAKALRVQPFSVTEKEAVPPSGDKHDYLSLAPYAWPDPNRPNGLPYVTRDGRINPERDSIPDHLYFSRIVSNAETLALAYYLTDDEALAQHAGLLLRAFFVDATTRMNPHLNFAQAVRGKESGRAAGIIDTAEIARLVDAVRLLSASPAFDEALQEGLTAWFRDYLTWLRESDLGRRESRSGNNHGTWYDVQVAVLALATGQVELAQETVLFSRKRRLARQVDPDGRQPEELARTRSWHYCLFNLRALLALASLGERVGVNLWGYQTPDGRSIRHAVEWLLPFALGQKPWLTPEIGGMSKADLGPIVRLLAYRLGDAQLSEIAAHLGASDDGPFPLSVE